MGSCPCSSESLRRLPCDRSAHNREKLRRRQCPLSSQPPLKRQCIYLLFIRHWSRTRTCREHWLTTLDCSREASSWITSQCSTRTPSWMRRMSAAIQFTGWPEPENRPCTITKSFSVTIVPGSYFSVGGMLLMRLNRPSDQLDMGAVLDVVG